MKLYQNNKSGSYKKSHQQCEINRSFTQLDIRFDFFR